MGPWVALAAGVIAYDVAAIRTQRPTLSAYARRLDRWPLARIAAVAGWLYLGDHLFGTRRWWPS